LQAELPLLTTKPTTVAGVVALLEYVSTRHYLASEEEGETILEYAQGWTDELLHGSLKAFPAHIAAALREIALRAPGGAA
jgi:hypothetical protein